MIATETIGKNKRFSCVAMMAAAPKTALKKPVVSDTVAWE
jgi:hypothetical protein